MTAPRNESRIRLFQELCELDVAARREALSRAAIVDPALAAEVERMLELDAAPRGPLEGLRDEVADAAERELRLRAESAERPPPARLGPWRLGERLGAGGMGEVWAAERVEGGFTQRAAVKLVRSGMAMREVIERFAIERQVLARLEHPAIATLLDGGMAPDGRPWFAMERVDGVPITRFAEERGLDVAARVRLLLDVAAAVEFAHRSLVVHRDLKPSNILVSATGEPKLLDFGLAKLLEPGFEGGVDPDATRTEFRALTPAYAAPEQILGQPVTTATDVYALGVILFELLTGETPHRRRASSATTLSLDAASEEIERPSQRLRRLASDAPGGRAFAKRIEGDLDTIVLKATARERERRYPTVAAFAADLAAHLAGRPIAARPDSLRYRAGKFVRRNRFGVAAATLTLASLIAALGISLVQTRRATLAAASARSEARRAERVKGFLISVFEQADPTRTMGAEMPARQVLEEGARRLESELGDEPEVRAELHDAVARIQSSLGLLDPALASAERAAAERARLFGAASVAHATSLATVANVLFAQGKLDEAAARIDEAVRLFEAGGEVDSVDFAQAISTRANVLMLRGDPAGALALERRAHAIFARQLGADDPETLEHLSNLAVIESEQANYEAAIATYREVLAILEPRQPPDSAAVLAVVLNLATALDIAGRSEEALAQFERVLAGRRRIFDPTHPLLAETMVIVSLRLSRAGRSEEALALLEEARAISTPSDHPELGSIDNYAGLVLSDLGRFAEAESAARRAVARFTRDLGASDLMVSAARGNLANAVAEQGRFAEALAIYEEVLAALAASDDRDNPRLLRIRLGWGATLRRLGRFAEARAAFEAVAAVARAKHDPGHVRFAEIELELARLELAERGAAAADVAAARVARAEEIVAGRPAAPVLARLLAATKAELASAVAARRL